MNNNEELEAKTLVDSDAVNLDDSDGPYDFDSEEDDYDDDENEDEEYEEE